MGSLVKKRRKRMRKKKHRKMLKRTRHQRRASTGNRRHDIWNGKHSKSA
jgi:hypothetical protein